MLQQFDTRNENIWIFVKDGLYRRAEAKVSVFDSVVQGGDAVWEGIRIYDGKVFCLDRHLDRLFHSAKALAFAGVPGRSFIKEALFDTLRANGMRTNTHVRLTLTRGEKITSGMDPRLNRSGCCLIVLAEWKPLVYDNKNGIRAVSTSVLRNSPRHLDSKIHHNNLLNNILAKIQANVAGVDAGLMLDAYGFVSEFNGTNIFVVRKGRLLTPHADACLNGITRGLVLEMAEELAIPARERNISLSECYSAEEVFASGTMGELTPVVEIDGRHIGNPAGWPVFKKLERHFRESIPALGEVLPF